MVRMHSELPRMDGLWLIRGARRHPHYAHYSARGGHSRAREKSDGPHRRWLRQRQVCRGGSQRFDNGGGGRVTSGASFPNVLRRRIQRPLMGRNGPENLGRGQRLLDQNDGNVTKAITRGKVAPAEFREGSGKVLAMERRALRRGRNRIRGLATPVAIRRVIPRN